MTNFRRDDESPSEYAERTERAEGLSGWYFTDATKEQLARFNDRMAVAAAYKGAPKWDRFRLAAQREFKRTTQAAAELCNLTFAELMATGEVSEALSYRWDELAVAGVMQQAAE
jgi:hypothetical protein